MVDAGSDYVYSEMTGNWYKSTKAEHFIIAKENLNDGQWNSLVSGNVNMTLNYTTVDRDVFGTFYKHIDTSNLDSTKLIGVKGKTTITLNNSVVKGDLRGGNGEGVVSTDATYLAGNAKLGDIELNINNSLVEDEVVAVGGYMSAGDVKINVTGNSLIGYAADNHNNIAVEQDSNNSVADGWIVAGTQRPGGTVKSTEINLNTNGADNEIKIAGDIHAGSLLSAPPGNASSRCRGPGTTTSSASRARSTGEIWRTSSKRERTVSRRSPAACI